MRCQSSRSIPPEIGGSEGLVMSNRTNRTLSANTNGLNLGTRSLAKAGVFNGTISTTLRFRLAQSSRPGDFARVERAIFDPAITMPAFESAMPDSKRGTVDAERSKPPLVSPSGRSHSEPIWLWSPVAGTRWQVAVEVPPIVPSVQPSARSYRHAPRASLYAVHAQPRPCASTRACGATGSSGRSARLTASTFVASSS